MAKTDELSVLSNVIVAARAELRDRDPEDVPTKLKRAAAATGKRIPRPHERAILAHIEADDEFRDAVREAFTEAEFHDPLGLEFLTDPDTALPKVQLAVAEGVISELHLALEAAKAETASVQEKLAVSKQRYESARRESTRKLGERAEADKRARAGLERTASESTDRARQANASADALERDLDARATEIADLEVRLAKLNEKFTRRRQSLSRPPDESRSPVVSDPIEIAKDLDSQERGLRTYRKAHLGEAVQRADLAPMAVPNGLSTSDASVIDAVIGQMPDRVIIDGYNVAGLVNPGQFSTRPARDDVVNRAAKLVRETDAAIVVVFDAQQSAEGTSTFVSADGVKVVFEGDTIADDTIAAMAHADSDRCVVVTNDREIHNRVRRSGCISIFSTAFVSWTEHLNRS
jgi:predicted RNA-binding protein with PIN domain